MSPPVLPRRRVTAGDEKLAARCAKGRVVVIDDDGQILSALADLFEMEGYACETYSSAVAYLQVLDFNRPCFPGPACVLCDVRMPELDGLALQRRLSVLDDTPLLLMSGASGAVEAANAFRGGALDFLVKPFDADVVLRAIAQALAVSGERQRQRRRKDELALLAAALTVRERDVARHVAGGLTNVEIGHRLGIALRTVKRHRQQAMEKLGAESLADLVRIVDEAGLAE